MNIRSDLDVFLKPDSVAVIGASQRPGTWGSWIMEALLSRPFPGKIYPVNHQAEQVFGLPSVREVADIKGPVDLAILTVPAEVVEETIEACGRKQVKGIILITAGYSEALRDGRENEAALARLAGSYGMRLIGPNVGGLFNLHAEFSALGAPPEHILPTVLAGISQGGYAVYDLMAAGKARGMGVGKFIQTGNEGDLTVTDFLEYFGSDQEVRGILMCLETLRDGRRFLKVAREVAPQKPVVVYKSGRTPAAARAAQSHTGALSASQDVSQGLLRQAGLIISPSIELMLPLCHALVERPPMRGRRVAIMTIGGSWGVAMTETLEEQGLVVPELSLPVQETIRDLGIPIRASVKNPVDMGASGLFMDTDLMLAIGREILFSGEVDAMIMPGMGRPGLVDEETDLGRKYFFKSNKQLIQGMTAMERETDLPVLIGSQYTPWESQEIWDLNEEGIRIYNRLDDLAQLLSLMSEYWRTR